jgi:hypothetical protein
MKLEEIKCDGVDRSHVIQHMAVVFSLGYAKTSCINQNETQELLEPCSSSDPHTYEDSSLN